ncbi:hypothetical protein AAFF_G00307320 [Aldrovandia affinis]|uniref:Syntaxin-17 n=1 Tax=Aldrovandia affinis TaxID=143900 RepID=A0AAD7W0P1_9TELE|nr:hypothetical protein AAFF_G00307320 [Aldrovandia affinis]
MADAAARLPLRRLEPPILKFVKVAIPTDLERLRKHQVNIEKYQRCQQWERLHQEQINASRTVQQLRANMREMEKLCGRVQAEDAQALRRLVRPIRERASAAAHDFLELHAESSGPPRTPPRLTEPPPLTYRPLTVPDDFSSAGDGEGQLLAQTQIPLPEIPQDQNAAESWETLEEDLLELNGLVNEFSELVHSQQAKIDSIEDNVEVAAANVEAGSRSLGKAVKYKMAVLPVAGAVLGGVLGGPLGLLAGFKVAGVVAALSGGLLGYAGGNAIQRTRRANVDLQLQQLSSSGPQPPPTGRAQGEVRGGRGEGVLQTWLRHGDSDHVTSTRRCEGGHCVVESPSLVSKRSAQLSSAQLSSRTAPAQPYFPSGRLQSGGETVERAACL